MVLTRTSITITVVGLVAFEVAMIAAGSRWVHDGAVWALVEGAVFAAVVSFLVYSNLVYQTARLGYLTRRRQHRPATKGQLESIYTGAARPLVALVPSYREEPGVIRQTLLSAAFQEYPDKRVVLLIDDPPHPDDSETRQLLAAARALPAEVKALLAEPAARARAALAAFEARVPPDGGGRPEPMSYWLERQAMHLADRHLEAARWFESIAESEAVEDHTDALFVEQVLLQAATDHRQEADDLLQRSSVDRRCLWLGYRRLLARFEVEVTCFERKTYVNLSHEPNKARNLNSYIGLLGQSWRRVRRDDGWHLEPAGDGAAELVVPAATYVVTLDADSLLVPSYTPRLVHLLEQPGNERVAVTQTPYSAIPDAPGALEQMAGATTDIQYISHQGFTHYRATFWVGANALIRRTALDDLVCIEDERGYPVRRYIQDRTVIEDTESSVDLIKAGWQLVNYPERLSFSATPSDFGALVIQRRRWANGGLIILPKLLRHLARRRIRADAGGGWMRVQYLASISGANLGLLLLLSFPFAAPSATMWIPVTAVPYFFLYSRDLHQSGYRYRDMVQIYALNLLLVPVNLAGVAKSLQQGVTRTKIPFRRTPKVHGRTQIPALYLAAELLLLAVCAAGCGWDLAASRWAHAVFEAANVSLLIYAIGRFIGWRHLVNDLLPHRAPPPSAVPARPQAAKPPRRLVGV